MPPVNAKAATERSGPENAAKAPFDDLLEEIRRRRDEFSAARQISSDIVAKLKAVGVYRALVARRFGGEENTPAEFLRMVERLAIADGSTGWVASFGVASIYLAALPVATLRAVYAEGPDVVFAGGLFPPQPARLVDGGFEVSGRWKFGSGSTGADLIGVGIKTDAANGGLPRMAVMPASKVRIDSNWDVIGLLGTGSHDLVVEGVVVPEEWTFIRGGKPTLDEPLYRYPSMAFAAQVLAVVGMGVGRAAIDEISAMAAAQGSITGAPVLADRAYVQIEIAKAEAALRSARAFFYEATEEAFERILAGDELPVARINLLRLASSHVARVGADVARTAYTLAGTTGIYASHPLSRYLQDASVVVQHAFLSEGTWQSAGRVMLGFDAAPGFP